MGKLTFEAKPIAIGPRIKIGIELKIKTKILKVLAAILFVFFASAYAIRKEIKKLIKNEIFIKIIENLKYEKYNFSTEITELILINP
ncbi:hypothetical protein NPA09_02720 [Mycoplasmopsis equigenitalium]|uniref:Uncharacterized protein n=1 Tax=Mycoplasmopsis equigenitalium TaxID=114883 RepID=A0ABY5J3R2_9BACT|nr:hypothetical protein [Mycoplasmopsis equigenitalium]UUD36787.1 hypothetical protein NPA09_02720 [Mycoplasmopsis equigenitalium]